PAQHRTALSAAFRLKVPQSLTVDQIETFDRGQIVNGQIVDNGTVLESNTPLSGATATDIRLHYAVHDSFGNPVNGLGELSALVQDNDKKQQTLVTAPCAATLAAGNKASRPDDCAEYHHGLSIPGEFGLSLYSRENVI